MKIITVEIKLAFEDIDGRTADVVANQLVRYALDGVDAEVCFTTKRETQTVDYPDFSYGQHEDYGDINLLPYLDDETIVAWHDKACEVMESSS